MSQRTLSDPGSTVKHAWPPFRTSDKYIYLILILFLCTFAQGQGPGDNTYTFDILENKPPLTEVGSIRTLPGKTYILATPTQNFSINSATGLITTKTTLDREEATKVALVVRGSDPVYLIEVTINILDVNDNAPAFPQPVVEVHFVENNVVGTRKILHTALDKDSGVFGTVSGYQIISGNDENKFDLDFELTDFSTYFFLVNKVTFNREDKASYILNISAHDGGNPPLYCYLTVNVIIDDTNDNAPVFLPSTYSVTVNESTPAGTSILKVQATDQDIGPNGEITYNISNEFNLFAIDEYTGVVTTRDTLNCPNYQCSATILATDRGAQGLNGRAYLTVVIEDENDHRPVISFTPLMGGKNRDYIAVNESIKRDQPLAVIQVTDKDRGRNAQTNLTLLSGNEEGHFKIRIIPRVGGILLTASALDRERISTYNLTFIAVDFGNPPLESRAFLIIHVTDANDHSPQFEKSSYSSSLSELAPIGSFVMGVTARDDDDGLNAKIKYVILSGNQLGWFRIDEETGLVTTAKDLDREVLLSNPYIVLNISAQDGGIPSFTAHATLTVFIQDENDQTPTFAQTVYTVTLSEADRPNTHVITLTATDNDQGLNGTVIYAFANDVEVNYPGKFKLNPSSGDIRTLVKLDREQSPSYVIKVIASDQGSNRLTSTATVVVNVTDLNDNPPVFYPSQYYQSIIENQPLGVSVVQVQASDSDAGDNAKISYSIASGADGKFTIDATSGWITTLQSLRRQQKDSYTLEIRAIDHGTPAKSSPSSALVVINVIRESQNTPPTFNSTSGYLFSVVEDNGETSLSRRWVGALRAQFQDGSSVTYSITGGDPYGNFEISSGVIRTAKLIDREKTSHYMLTVTASGGLVHGETTVNITVVDLNDNYPQFPVPTAKVYVVENWPIGHEVYLASAKDSDEGSNALLSYRMVSSSPGIFDINSSTGMIFLSQPVSLGTAYTLTVTATDSGQKSSDFSLDIVVTDVNDHSPVFSRNIYEFSVDESRDVNYRFAQVTATDLDRDLNGKVTYSITVGNVGAYFGIFPDGILYIAKALDRETRDQFLLTVKAVDHGVEVRSALVNVSIHVTDANDNVPMFSNGTYDFYIEENSAAGSDVGTVSATDFDLGRNSELTFSIVDSNDAFEIDPLSGAIQSLSMFDRESVAGDMVQFKVRVTDNGLERLNSTCLVRVHVIDVNDNPPVFSQLLYTAKIKENAIIGSLVARVNTTDKDIGRNKYVFYTITSGNEGGEFALNRSTGQLILKRRLDRETKHIYELTILATDTAETDALNATATVRVQVLDFNDNRPVFNCSAHPCSVDVPESTSPGTSIGTVVATDADYGSNAAVSYSIAAGNTPETFNINADSGVIYLLGTLNYDNVNEYKLTIKASDSGDPQQTAFVEFTVRVVDHNDPPVFPSGSNIINMMENTGPNAYVTTITANDPDFGVNGQLTYSIKSQNPSGNYFRIEASTGKIFTNKNVDREMSSFYDLTIIVVDGAANPLSAEETITVNVQDKNDNSPVFVSMNAAIISAGASSGSAVMTVRAEDPDDAANGKVTYTVTSDLFQINTNDGHLTLKRTISGSPMTHLVTITAKDGGSPPMSTTSTLTVIVRSSTNNNQLSFGSSGYSGQVSENQPSGTSIVTVTATNPSNSRPQIQYYVTNVSVNGAQQPKPGRYFQINAQTGVLATAEVLDREEDSVINNFSVEVYAIDKGSTTPQTKKTDVSITLTDENDSAPVFTPNRYSVSILENSGTGQPVTTVTASDRDLNSRIRFAITSGSDGRFAIEQSSGRISTTDNLDREIKPRYILTVQASDGKHTSSAPVEVDILDLNDNAPKFSKDVYAFSVGEDTSRGTIVGYISASDNDASDNGTVTYSMLTDWGKNVFSLHKSKGVGVFTVTGILDREQFEHYVITVKAEDKGSPPLTSTTTVYINIMDSNDNAPVFDPASYSTDSLSEDAKVGTSVIQVHATDQDAGDNRQIEYSILTGDVKGQFRINKNTGVIYTAQPLDREKQPSYSLTVVATDKPSDSSQRLSSSATVDIILQDVNDEYPVFTSPDTVWVYENSNVGTTVATIHAQDLDESANGDVLYSLGPVDDNMFTISPTQGYLVVNGGLDRETKDVYSLTVTASDRATPPKTSQQKLTVRIRDENDNTPIWEEKQYRTTVPENAQAGRSLLTVSATDADVGLNGNIRYFILSGDDNQDFELERKTGVLRVLKKLDYERKKSYALIIQAEDSGTDLRMDTATATILVTDVNDNAPVFLHSPYKAFVQENMATLPVFVMRLSAHDADSGDNGKVSYIIREGDEGIFEINSTTGEIKATQALDREQRDSYRLIVTATDRGNPRLTGTGTVDVRVLDVNDHSPVFQQMSYLGQVPENSVAGTQVLIVRATDGDVGANAEIRYHLDNNAGGRFAIDAASGKIVTSNVALDREREDQYSLVVVATDGASSPRQATAHVTVRVLDANDNQPVFQKSSYDVYIRDSTNSGEFIAGVTAIDQDMGVNGRIVYSLMTYRNSFRIHQSTGVITAAQTLTSSTQSEYLVKVKASDQAQNPMFNETTVAVRFIVGVSRNQFPTWSTTSERFTVAEGSTNNQLTTVRASSPAGRSITYHIAGGNLGSSFDITAEGVVRLVKALDYEETSSIDLWIEARDSGNPSLSSFLRLSITVEDLNDNPPIFTESCYVATVLENARYPHEVKKVKANDADSGANGRVVYSITSGNVGDVFTIDSISGEVTVAMNKVLDRETLASYSLIIIGVDQGTPSRSGQTKLDITIGDVNDKEPMFTSLLDAAVAEDSVIGTFVIQVRTTDKDIGDNARPEYTLVDPSGTFVINRDTGVVTVNQHLDRESHSQYQLRVKCTDGTFLIQTGLTIYVLDVNDEAPTFNVSLVTFNFKENTGANQKVSFVGDLVAVDNDDRRLPNSEISYTLKYPSDKFSLKTLNGRGQIFTKKIVRYTPPIDGRVSPSNRHSLIVIARDSGIPSLSSEVSVMVNVVDANDNPPVFDKTLYSSPVPENFAVGRSIIQVSARDDIDFGLNAEVEYAMASGGNGSSLFDINPATGWVRVKSLLSPSMRNVDYVIRVNALDKGSPRAWCTQTCPQPVATVRLTVTEVNVAAPVFTESNYQVTIPENKAVGSVLKTITARDSDSGLNGRVSYFISGGDSEGQFSIGESDGNIKIVKSLDYDTKREYNLNIEARDGGLLYKSDVTTFKVILTDVNDNVPSFSQASYDTTLAENSPSGTFVFQVQATDPDSGSFAIIQYSIVGDAVSKNIFTIDRQTGEIRSRVTLDYEARKEYTISVIATNPGDTRENMASVHVHLTGVNEFYPKFVDKHYVFEISESVTLGSSVGQVLATDADHGVDGDVLYFLVGDSNNKGFAVGKINGSILVTRKLDRESVSNITLQILAKNEGPLVGNDSDVCTVTITLEDANDPPIFTQQVYNEYVNENVQVGATVTNKVSANDADLSPANRMFKYGFGSGNVDNAFSIDPDSGLVTVTAQLDRETLPEYKIIVTATDFGSPPLTGSATLSVKIEDSNDNGPYFEPSVPSGDIQENQGPFTSVMNLRPYTKDPDEPLGPDPYKYQLLSYQSLFDLNEKSGLLRTKVQLDREQMATYLVQVGVADGGIPEQTSTLSVQVVVLDLNDNPPTSRSVTLVVNTYGSIFPGGKIGDVKPLDADTTGVYSCTISEGAAGLFAMSPQCVLRAQPRDDIDNTYTLKIRGNDGEHTNNVISTANILFQSFDNDTLKNSASIRLSNITGRQFMEKSYTKFLQKVKSLSGSGQVVLYSIQPDETNLDLFLAVKQSSGAYLSSSELRTLLLNGVAGIESTAAVKVGSVDDACTGSPCKNGGGCSSHLEVANGYILADSPVSAWEYASPIITKFFKCSCPSGFVGPRCENVTAACISRPCKNGGSCVAVGVGQFRCDCPTNYQGRTCEDDVDECRQKPCKNEGTCINTVGSFRCQCAPGFTGATCDPSSTPCSPNPCKNKGVCRVSGQGFQCQCEFGFYGDTCQESSAGFSEDSYSEYGSLQSFENVITMDIATAMKKNALLLYNAGTNTSGHFLAVEIVNGNAKFSFQLGNSNTRVEIVVPKTVADGKWHRVKATRKGRVGTLMVSDCPNGPTSCNVCPVSDNTCVKSATSVGSSSTLDVSGHNLHLGGLQNINTLLQRAGKMSSFDFVGCMANVEVDSSNLFTVTPLKTSGVSDTCPRLHTDSCTTDTCSNGGQCIDEWSSQRCQCPKNFLSEGCKTASQPFSFGSNARVDYLPRKSYVREQVLAQASNRRRRAATPGDNTVSLQFRTLKENGLLFMSEGPASDYTVLQVIDHKVRYLSRKNGIVTSISSNVNVSDSAKHSLQLTIKGTMVTLTVDSISQSANGDLHDFLGLDIAGLSLGNTKTSVTVSGSAVVGFIGCISDFTLNGEEMPYSGATDRFVIVPSSGDSGNAPTCTETLCLSIGCDSDNCKVSAGKVKCVSADQAGLSIGVIIVIAFFSVVVVGAVIFFIVFRLRKTRAKAKQGPEGATRPKHTNGVQFNLNKSQTESTRTLHDCGFTDHDMAGVDMPDDAILASHLAGEMSARKYNEREVRVPHPRPDIIEPGGRQLSRATPVNIGDGTVIIDDDLDGGGPEQAFEHYDLDNASSIAPSDIDVIQHYRAYRDRKAVSKPQRTHKHAHVHSPVNGPGRPATLQGRDNPLVRQSPSVVNNPVIRQSPLPVASSRQTPLGVRQSPLTVNNLSRQSPHSAITRQSPYMHANMRNTPLSMQQHVRSPSNLSDSDNSVVGIPDPRLHNLSPHSHLPGSRPASRPLQPGEPMGLTLNDVRLNSRQRASPVSTLDAVSSSSDGEPMAPAIPRPNANTLLEAPESSSDESSSNDSFTCSEFEYENEKVRNDFDPNSMIFTKVPEEEAEDDESLPPIQDTQKMFTWDNINAFSSTVIPTSDDGSSVSKRSRNGTFNWDYLLNWGPSFEKLVGVFGDIAQLPDNQGALETVPPVVTDREEYV